MCIQIFLSFSLSQLPLFVLPSTELFVNTVHNFWESHGYMLIHCQTEGIEFEVFTAVTMKNAVLWNVTLCGSCKNLRFGGTYRLHHQCGKNQQLMLFLAP
jgi:hypothetical protein